MPTQQKRRDGKRVPCLRAYPYALTKPGNHPAKFSEGHGYAINHSVGGMLLLLPEKVDQRQVVEIQVPSKKAKKKQSTKLGEVCWTHPIQVDARVRMYLVGIRFLFEHHAPGESPQIR